MNPLGVLSFARSVAAAPSVGVFFPDETVLAVLEGPGRTSESEAATLAELLVRFFFRREKDLSIRNILESRLGSPLLEAFACAANRLEQKPRDYVPERALETVLRGAAPDVLRSAIRKRLQPVLEADGFVPVILPESWGGGARLLPFSFRPGQPFSVVDETGSVVPGWTGPMQRLATVARKMDRSVRVSIRLSAVPPCRSGEAALDGDSHLLPVLMAWWRKTNELPPYNVFRFFATGSIDDLGRLRPVDWRPKFEAVRNRVPGGELLVPVDARAEPGLLPIRPGQPAVEALDAEIRPLAEERFAADWQYAVRRMGGSGLAIEIGIRRYGRWDSAIARLKGLLPRLSEADDPDKRAALLMLLGEACCHAGRTEEALDYNRRARDLASRLDGFAAQMIRLDIEQIVSLNDREDFGSIPELANDLSSRLEAPGDSIDSMVLDDLRMRFHGTMGQAHAYGFLARVPAFSKEASLDHFQKAVALAKRCRERAIGASSNPEADPTVAERTAEVCHDVNYVHLWHALFRPEETRDAWDEAVNWRQRLPDGGGEAAKNRSHLVRQQGLAEYRRLLEEPGSPPRLDGSADEDDFRSLIEDDKAEFWLRATTEKYLGAILAARGRRAEALDLFREADRRIRDNPWHSPVLNTIRLSILAEAFRSLRNAPEQPFCSAAASFRDEALRLCSDLDRSATWRAWLESPDSTPFPGLSYWY